MTLPNVMTPKIGGNDQYHIDIKVLRDTLQKSDFTPKQLTTMLKTLPRASMISEVKNGSSLSLVRHMIMMAKHSIMSSNC